MSDFKRVLALLTGLIGCCATALAAVEIEGLPEEFQQAVLSAVSLSREACDAPDWRIDALLRRAPDEVANALEARGHYAATVVADLTRTRSCWIVRLAVEPGAPVLIRDVGLHVRGEATGDPEFESLLADTTLVVGRQLDHAEYERVKAQLIALAQRKGYADAIFSESRIDVYPDDLAADITLELDSGARYAFGEIIVAQDFLNFELVEGFVDFEPGDPFDRNELTRLYNSLIDSGYFGVIDIRPLAANPELRQIPVQVELTPGNQKVLSYGGGYSTDTGPRLRITRTNRRLNARGAQLSMNAELSPVLSEFWVGHRFPHGDPRAEWISFDAGILREDSETIESEKLQLGARRIITRWGDWQETHFIDFTIEDFEIADEAGRTTILQPGIAWLRVRADNTIRPVRGDRFQFEISASSDRLVSDTSFVQTIAEARWIRSLGNGARVLTRLRAASTWNSDFDALPPSARYFAGGDSSIRGYEFRSQGPVDADGELIGGDRLLVGSAEYEHPIRERWSFATFYDAGNAFHGHDVNAIAGFGIGTRWLSPLGPIRLDIAKPLDGADRDLRLHISLGPDL
jgi:translocation and assembly module TamA